jgi:ABC-type bacteriocin/lantibiotic exporter with double-glycine peptidase domain
MHKQRKPHWCGPASVQNALEALGKRVSQKLAAEYLGTTELGTSEFDIVEGLQDLGFETETFSHNHKEQARCWLTWELTYGRPVLLSTEDWGHWITVVTPPLSRRFGIVDPEEGVIRLVHWKTLERVWRAAARVQTGPADRTYYAISVRG